MAKSKTPTGISNLSKAALVGFTLTSLGVPKQAHGYYAVGYALLSLTTTAVGGGVYLTVKAAMKSGTAQLSNEGDPTRTIIEAAVMERQSDVGLQLQLLAESPTAFNQLDHDVALGHGRALDSLTNVLGTPSKEIATLWENARAGHDDINDSVASSAVVEAFAGLVYPRIEVQDLVLADFVWQMVVESQQEQEMSGTTQAWLGGLLGVPVIGVNASVKHTLAGLGCTDLESARKRVYGDPDLVVAGLSRTIEARYTEEIQKQLDSLLGAGTISIKKLQPQHG